MAVTSRQSITLVSLSCLLKAPLMNRYLLVLFLCLTSASYVQAAQIVDFDELIPPASGFFDGYGANASTGTWQSQGVTFNTNPFGPGWSYSNVNDNTTAGFANQYAAITELDFSGSGNYVIGTALLGGAFIEIPTGYRADSLRVTNTTFSALSILNGDSFAKQFGGSSGDDPDFFKVTFVGHSLPGGNGTTTGSIDFFLADYRFDDNDQDFVVDTWELLDLTSLGDARSIEISFDSSDIGEFGINTPAYVAIDNLELTSMPEPNSILAIAGLGIAAIRRRR